MTNTSIVFIFFALLICFSIRSWWRLFFHKSIALSDTYHHLKIANIIRDIGLQRFNKEILPGYPAFYHWLLSLLPRNWLLGWERINGAFMDSLHLLLFVLIILIFAPSSVLNSTLVWGTILLAFCPAWLKKGFGPRAYGGTERTLSEVQSTGTFLGMWLFISTGNYLWLLISIVISASLLNTSRFAGQVLISFTVLISIFNASWELILVPFAAAPLAHLISGGNYFLVMRKQWNHLKWYMGAINNSSAPVSYRNSWSNFVLNYRQGGMVRAAKYLAFNHSIFIGLLQHFPILLVVTAFLFGVGRLPDDSFVYSWIVAAVIVWLVISTRWLMFLGEPDRYLIYAVIPEYFVIASWATTVSGIWGLGILGLSIMWWILQQIMLFRSYKPIPAQIAQDKRKLIDFLQSLPVSRLLTHGDSLFMWEMAYHTEHKHFLINSDVLFKVAWEDIFFRYPYPSLKAVKLLQSEIIAVEKSSISDQSFSEESCLSFEGMTLVFDNKNFQVFSIQASY